MSKHEPYRNLGPGYSIKRNMEACGWNQKDLSEILGISEKHVSGLINNKKPITLRMARLLAHTFSGSPRFWMNLDTNYRLRLEETVEEKKTDGRASVYIIH